MDNGHGVDLEKVAPFVAEPLDVTTKKMHENQVPHWFFKKVGPEWRDQSSKYQIKSIILIYT